MTKVIILQGNDNIGKTTTLKLVVRKLLDNKARLIAFSNNFAKWIRGDEVGDIWAIMEYKNEIIFITTRGDYPKCILNDFDSALQMAKLDANKVDVFICAAYNKTQVSKVFKRLNLSMLNPIIINKNPSPTKANDMADAKMVFSHI